MNFAILLRHERCYKRELFVSGMQACGYVETVPAKADVLIIWNRYGQAAHEAALADVRGAKVLVAENATWGNEFAGKRWYSLWPDLHNRADKIREGGPKRWDSLDVELPAWRTGSEVIGLPQRGIGPRGVAMPRFWNPPGCTRIRRHPGKAEATPLDKDLKRAGKVVTWGSGAAVKALLMGIPVESHMPQWAGEQDNTDAGRLAMFRRLAWAQWTHEELESGEAFKWFGL